MDFKSTPCSVIIIGGGFSGLIMACKLKRTYGFENYVIYDRNDQMGGTWWANTYPGCAVDIPAFCYSLSFAPNPNFTQLFPRQPEILEYMHDVAERYDVKRHIIGRTEWKGAQWQEETQTWIVFLEDLTSGKQYTRECQVLISAVGGLVNPNRCNLPGMETFQGSIMHTAMWDSSLDLTNKRVAVIGNGASATQLVPAIAGKPSFITQYMRTPHHLVPSRNYTFSPSALAAFRYIPGLMFVIRFLMFLYMELTILYFGMTQDGQQKRQEAVKQSVSHIKSNAPEKYWRMLIPEYTFGCRRRVFDQSYTTTLQRQDVRLTDDPIVQVQGTSILTESGDTIPTDVILLATGFSLTQYDVDLRGRHGKTRAQHWREMGAKAAFKTVAMHGFPNFFYLLGPNSGHLHTSALSSIESHADLVISVLKPVISGQASSVEVKVTSESQFVQDLHTALDRTVHNDSCSSFLIDKESGKNWFVYPWDSLHMWVSTHWNVMGDWIYTSNTNY